MLQNENTERGPEISVKDASRSNEDIPCNPENELENESDHRNNVSLPNIRDRVRRPPQWWKDYVVDDL